jgi:hypothetical protein
MSLVELGRYERIEAHLIVGRLDSEGIDAVAFDGGASIADGSWLLIRCASWSTRTSSQPPAPC